MPETRTDWLIFAVGAGLVALLLTAIVLHPHKSRSSPPARAAPVTRATTSTSTPTTTATPPTTTRVETVPARHAKTRFTIRAARGSSWVSVRIGSPTGHVLYAGTLGHGRAVSFAETRLYLGFGAAANVDVSVNGRPIPGLPSGTAAVLIGSTGRWVKTAYVG
jgi:hypothetical protein